jgi:hypothetical protein
MKSSNLLMLSIIAMFLTIACWREDDTTWTSAEGYVINQADSKAVSDANVFILHWDGSSTRDTLKILETKSDSVGFFYLRFDGVPGDFFWVKAEKEGYVPSTMKTVDVGASTRFTLNLNP